MSIILQFNSSFIQSAPVVSSTSQCRSIPPGKLGMVPRNDQSAVSVMSENGRSNHNSNTSHSVLATHVKESRNSSYGLPYQLQDHNYGAPPPPTPPSLSPCPSPLAAPPLDEDTNLSGVSVSTEEAKEESITRCICGFEHDDEYMICCDNCLVWQHVDCMELDRKNMPDTYLCDKCEPRKLDRQKAKALQARKRIALSVNTPMLSPEVKQEFDDFDFNNQSLFKYTKNKMPDPLDSWDISQTSDFSTLPHFTSDKYYGTSDSDEAVKRSHHRRTKARSKRRKKDDFSAKKRKSYSKLKVKFSTKHTKLKRIKTKDSTSTADEEAQDAWEYNTQWREENYEAATNNQYTPEVQQLAKFISIQGYEKKFMEQLRSKQCEVQSNGNVNQLMCICDLPRNQPIIEYRGKYLLASQFHEIHPLYNKRLYPFVLFYNMGQEEICVDASFYGNDARFVRRSCRPNAEIRHLTYNGNLHLYLASTKVIFKDDEVTLPFVTNHSSSYQEECACGLESCTYKSKKINGDAPPHHDKKKSIKRTLSVDDDSTSSVHAAPAEKKSFEKVKLVPERSRPPSERRRGLSEKAKVVEKLKCPVEKEKPTSEKIKTTVEKRRPSIEKNKQPIEKSRQSVEKSRLPVEKSRLPVEKSKLPVEKNKLPVEKSKLPVEKNRLPVEKNRLSIEKNTLFIEKSRISVEKSRPPTEKRVPFEKSKIQPEKKRISTERLRAPSERGRTLIEKGKLSYERLKVEQMKTPEKIKTPEKVKASPVKMESFDHNIKIEPEDLEGKTSSDHEGDDQSGDHKKKLTREERKLDAIMKAFDMMEKAERRRQQAAERHKTHTPVKAEEDSFKTESPPTPVKEEVEPPLDVKSTAEDEEKPPPPTKQKRGKRRRGSGTPSRRRTRTNSGGSDIMSHNEETLTPSTPTKSPILGLDNSVPLNSQSSAASVPNAPSPFPVLNSAASPVVLRPKRFLLAEWLHEKADTVPNNTATPPLTPPVSCESKWSAPSPNPACFIRCTKDSNQVGGISAAHLRRSSSAGQLKPANGQGNAKKRWLRQAMYDSTDDPLAVETGCIESLENGCLSPNSHADTDSPGPILDDVITPLKKRRLLRESVESLSSPHSMDDTDATVSNSLVSDASTDHGHDIVDQELLCLPNKPILNNHVPYVIHSPKEDDSLPKVNGIGSCADKEIIDVEFQNNHDHLETSENQAKPSNGEENHVEDINIDELMVSETKKEICDYSQTNGVIKTDVEENMDCIENGLESTLSNSLSPIDVHVEATSPKDKLSESDLSDADSSSMDQPSPVKVLEDEALENSLTSPPHITLDVTSFVNTAITSEITPDVSINSISAPPSEETLQVESLPILQKQEVIDSVSVDAEEKEKTLSEADITSESLLPKVPQEAETNPSESSKTVNKEENCTNDVAESCVLINDAICSSEDTCNSVDKSSDGVSAQLQIDKETHEPEAQNQCSFSEESSPVKIPASATQKRKVSLSEYRKRMKENASKPPPTAEAPKRNSLEPPSAAAMISETSLEQLTLAPLPLFDKHRTPRMSSLKSTTLSETSPKVKNDAALVLEEPINEDAGPRENLEERLKREFGFDVSEDTPVKSLLPSPPKPNSNNAGTMPQASMHPPQVPPPPPPRRPPMHPHLQTTPQHVQYGPYPHPSYHQQQPPPQTPQSQYLVPQGHVTPYMNPRPPPMSTPILQAPPIQMDPRSMPCGARPALLTSTRTYPSVASAPLLPTPRGNAQRFATPIATSTPPPMMNHKQPYPRVYQPGLYK